MMRGILSVCVILVALAVAANARRAPAWHQLESSGYSFADYVVDFNRQYSPEEYAMRKGIFDARLEEIKAHNRAGKSWKEGVNQFTDQTVAEFKQLLGYRKDIAYNTVRKGTPYAFKGFASLPKKVDWREHGVISAVKDQGRCGSCWTFGTAEGIESHWAMKKGQLPTLSEQQILDCTANPNKCGGTGGCGGGTAEIAMTQIMKQGGLSSEWTYPYKSYYADAFQCQFNTTRTPVAAKITGYVNLPANKYEPVMEALAHEGPLIVNVDASVWNKYEAGVFDGCNQTNPDIDHVVQLVGYGTEKDDDYWLIRNSWTPAWGEDGYIRLKRRERPLCGTDLNPQDGTGCQGGPPTVQVCGTCGVLFDALYPTVA